MMGLLKKFLSALVSLCCIFQPVVSSSGHPCSALRRLENGQTFFRYGGLYATFSCHHGYQLHGHRTNSCVSGRWTREPPICVGSGCRPPSPVARGSFRVNTDASWVDFSCNSGYKLVGPSRLYCKGNKWNSSPPLCEEPDLMQSIVFRETPQKLPVTQTLQTIEDLKDKASSHPKISTNLRDTTDMSMSNSSNEQSKPHKHQEPNSKTLNSSKNPEHPEPQTLHTSFTSPRKYMPSSETTTSLKTLSISFASTSINDQTMVSQATTVLPSRHMHSPFSSKPTYAPYSSRIKTEDADQANEADHQSERDPQSSASTKSSITQPYVTVKSFQSNKGTTFSGHTIIRSEINVNSSPTYKLANAATIPPPDLTTRTDQAAPQNIPEISQQPVHKSPTVSTFTSPSPSEKAVYSNTQTDWKEKSTNLRTSASSCPSPPAPAHGTFYFRNNENSGRIESEYFYIQYVCDHGFSLANGNAVRFCQDGAAWSGTAPDCVDVDECAFTTAMNGCLFGCVNVPGSFYCLCPSGYTLLSPDHTICQDIDECADNGGAGPCSEQCHNTPGSFHCSCSYGFTLAPDRVTCVPECPKGYRKQPLSLHNSTLPSAGRCVDINECEDEKRCGWMCINLPGTYLCICPRGHILTQDGRVCQDIDECSRNNGGCSHNCINLKGSYKCACPLSHRFSAFSWKKCVPRL